MTATLLRCNCCGHPVDEYGDEAARLGRCCTDLIAWEWDEESRTYTRDPRIEAPESESDDEDEDREDLRVRCDNCGSTELRVYAERNNVETLYYDVDTVDNDLDDNEVYVDEFSFDRYDTTPSGDIENARVECRNCGRHLPIGDRLVID